MGPYLLPTRTENAQAMQGEMVRVAGPQHQKGGMVQGAYKLYVYLI